MILISREGHALHQFATMCNDKFKSCSLAKIYNEEVGLVHIHIREL